MRTIYKYLIDNSGALRMPKGATILAFMMQHDKPTIWADVDDEAVEQDRFFQIFGTGHRVPEGATYHGTVQDGPFVWHLFEVTEVRE